MELKTQSDLNHHEFMNRFKYRPIKTAEVIYLPVVEIEKFNPTVFKCHQCHGKLRIPIKNELLKKICPKCKSIIFFQYGNIINQISTQRYVDDRHLISPLLYGHSLKFNPFKKGPIVMIGNIYKTKIGFNNIKTASYLFMLIGISAPVILYPLTELSVESQNNRIIFAASGRYYPVQLKDLIIKFGGNDIFIHYKYILTLGLLVFL